MGFSTAVEGAPTTPGRPNQSFTKHEDRDMKTSMSKKGLFSKEVRK